MTKLFERGVKAIGALPAENQDIAGALLLELAGASAAPEYALTPEQIEDVKAAVEEANRGEFATESDVAETWRHFGR